MSKQWFRSKRYGYGWTPVSVEGWIAVFLYAFLIAGGLCYFSYFQGIVPDNLWISSFFIYVFGWTVLLCILCYKKGERPRLSWGHHRKTE